MGRALDPTAPGCPEGPGAKAEVSPELERDADAPKRLLKRIRRRSAPLSTPLSRCRVCEPALLGCEIRFKINAVGQTQLSLKIYLFIGSPRP